MTGKNYWSETEMIVCLAVYATMPIAHRKSPPNHVTKNLSDLLGRTQSSIELRFANFSHHDPQVQELGLKGMSGGGAKVAEVWNKFSSNDGMVSPTALLQWVAMEYFKAMNSKFSTSENPGKSGDENG